MTREDDYHEEVPENKRENSHEKAESENYHKEVIDNTEENEKKRHASHKNTHVPQEPERWTKDAQRRRYWHKLARTYLETGDLMLAYLSLHPPPQGDTKETREIEKYDEKIQRKLAKIRENPRFHRALAETVKSLAISTCYRVSQADRGKTAIDAVTRLAALVGVSLSDKPHKPRASKPIKEADTDSDW